MHQIASELHHIASEVHQIASELPQVASKLNQSCIKLHQNYTKFNCIKKTSNLPRIALFYIKLHQNRVCVGDKGTLHKKTSKFNVSGVSRGKRDFGASPGG